MGRWMRIDPRVSDRQIRFFLSAIGDRKSESFTNKKFTNFANLTKNKELGNSGFVQRAKKK